MPSGGVHPITAAFGPAPRDLVLLPNPQGRFDPVHDPGALAHQAFALAGGAPGIFFRKGRNGSHVTMLRLAPQPAEKHALEQGRGEPVGLGAPMLAGDGDARRVNDMSFNAVSPEPARQPEAVAAGFEGDGNACDLPAGLTRLCAPAVEELEKGVLVGSEFLERMTLDPRHPPPPATSIGSSRSPR